MTKNEATAPAPTATAPKGGEMKGPINKARWTEILYGQLLRHCRATGQSPTMALAREVADDMPDWPRATWRSVERTMTKVVASVAEAS